MCLLEQKCKESSSSKNTRPAALLDNQSLFSRITYSWPNSLLRLGLQKVLEEKDLPELSEEDTSAFNLDLMVRLCSSCNAGGSLQKALVFDFIKSVWFIQPQYAIESAAKIVQAISLGRLIDTFRNDGLVNKEEGFIWASILVACGLIMLVTHHQIFFFGWRRGMQYRVAAIAAIYSKTLRLPSNGGVSNGMAMNLASNDVERFIMASLFISYLFWGPLEAIVVLVIGINILGPAFAFGYILLTLIFPAQFYLSKQFAKYRHKIAQITDKRVNLLSQAVSGVRVMKMSGWETSFEQRIADIRQAEMKQIRRSHRLKSMNEAIFFCCSVVIATVVLVIHVVALDGEITSGKVFTTISLLSLIQFTMGKFFAFGVMSTAECTVSVRRLQRLLSAPEIPPIRLTNMTDDSNPNRVGLRFSDVTCFWNEDWRDPQDSTSAKFELSIDNESDSSSSAMALRNFNFEYRLNELLCVIGSVGSGKTALLQAIAGELPPSKGAINRNFSSMAYATQDPWIMDGTVRENIIIGRQFDANWYKNVIKAVGLDLDFTQLNNSDQTIVGDRGVQLSGGQRARIGLARALYLDTELLLLDDPLSAVDAKVGRLIFDSAIQELRLNRGKGVILVTHQHQFIGNSRCILLSQGTLKCDGTYEECIAASAGFLSTMIQGKPTDRSETVENDSDMTEETKIEESKQDEAFKEQSASGTVGRSTFVEYGKAMGGYKAIILLFLLFSAAQASVLYTIRRMGQWAESSNPSSLSEYGAIIGYCVLVILLAAAMALVSIYLMLRASQTLHDNMTTCVLSAQIAFFDTNPLGRILNRFSADVGVADDLLPSTLYDFLVTAFFVLGGLAAAIFALPIVLIGIPPLVWYFMKLRNTFLATSREAKRLEGLARSPIFSMLAESFSGISTIRACDSTAFFKKKFKEMQDGHTRAFFSFIAASRWLGFRLDFIVVLFLALSCFLTVSSQYFGWFNIEPPTLGLALLMLCQLSGTFQWCVRQSAEVVNHMISTERILAFSCLPSEAARKTDADMENMSWPTKGSIEFEGVSVRYRKDLPPSLNDISFSVNSGERIGVVGRTGSGKSTLIQALFRIIETEGGTIKVDNTDISTLGLHHLRTGMSVIPQYPVLFSGCTVRENLDPFNQYCENDVLEALKDAQMLDCVMGLPDGLNTPVAEGGTNFSVGQRQLLCLSRAILRKSKLLVLDEPTANVDSRTDELLQKAVAKSFVGSTIISVAHRLDTVIEYNKILVLGNGKILEFGTPHDLINRDGHFKSMVDDSGEGMSKKLQEKAYLVSTMKG